MSGGLILTQILNGISIGLIYTIVALGLTIILGLMGVINFAHGSGYLLGAYIAFTITSLIFGNFWISLIICAFVGAALGITFFFAVVRPLRDRSALEPMVALIGMAMIFREIVRGIWGATPKLLPIPLGSIEISFFGFSFKYPQYFLVTMVISIVLLGIVYYLFHKTDLGIRCLACIQDREMALSLGVDANRIALFTFIIGMALAAFGGGLAGPVFSVYPTMGMELLGLLFIIVIVGGLGSIEGTVIAGVGIAVVSSVSRLFVSGNIAGMIVYGILLVVLLVRPRGIRGFEKVLE